MKFGIQILFPPFIHIYLLGVEFYLGWRPTPPWEIGIGNEGIFPKIAQWLKKIGFGNLGFALRRQVSEKVGWQDYKWIVTCK